MAVFVTNPASRSNGAVNILLAKHLGVNIRTESGRKAVAAFKRTAAYKAWLTKSTKAITSERAAKKTRTAASKTPAAKKARAAFIAGVKKKGGRKAGRKAAVAAVAAAPKAGKAGKAPNRIEKMANGKVMYFIDGKPTGRLKYEAAMATKKGAAAPARKAAAKAPSKAKKGAKRKAKKNPYGFFRRNGALDSYEFLKGRVASREGLMAAGTAFAAGAAFYYATPWIAEKASALPVVGEYADKAMDVIPYTLTGLLVGALAVGVGYAVGQGSLGVKLGLATASGGILVDTMGYLNSRSDKGALMLPNPAYGALEVTNPNYGGLVAVSNPGYGADDAAAAAEYNDATEADAFQSGEDFDEDEGQALLGGPRAFFQRFGRPARVASRHQSVYSRHAGKPGHKWGFLIKLLGFRRVSEIAAMPIQQRLGVLGEIKARCIASFNALMQSQSAGRDPYMIGMSSIGDMSAQGADAYAGYGSIVYAS